MVFLYFILLTFTFINASPTGQTFFTEFHKNLDNCQIVSKTNFTNVFDSSGLNCYFKIPNEIPKLKILNFMSVEMHFCMGIYETASKLCDPNLQSTSALDFNRYFNRSIDEIISEFKKNKNITQELCENFNIYRNINVETSPWLHSIHQKFKDPTECKHFCIDEGDVAVPCLLIYEINRILDEFNVKNQNLPIAVNEQQNEMEDGHVSSNFISRPGYHGQQPDKGFKLSNDAIKITPQTEQKQDQINLTNSPVSAGSPTKHSDPVTNKEPNNNEISFPNKQMNTNPAVVNINNANFENILSRSDKDPPMKENDEGDNRFNKPSLASTPLNGGMAATASISKVEQSSGKLVKKPETSSTTLEQNADLKDDQSLNNVESDFTEGEDFIPQNASPAQGDKLPGELSKDDRMVSDKEFSESILPRAPEANSMTEKRLSSTLYVQQVDSEVSLMPWYLMVIFCIFLVYLSFANKKKIVAYVVEGRPGSRSNRRSRPNTANYRKLDSNLEEAITSNCSTTTSHVIY